MHIVLNLIISNNETSSTKVKSLICPPAPTAMIGLGSSETMVKHIEDKHNVHEKLNSLSTHVAYCQDCHRYIGKKKVGVVNRKALEKHLHNHHNIDIQEN